MKVKEFIVEPCERNEIRDFIEEWHYSKNINGLSCKHNFKLMYEGEIIGACIFGQIAMAGVWKKYVDDKEKLIELRRLCCIDETPKNTESYFVGKCLNWLKNNTRIETVISYSYLTYNHTGIIYKASNFELIGQTNPGKVIMYNGKRYHDKTIRTKYKGELKPFAKRIKDALETGEAFYTTTKEKNIYRYDLESKRKYHKRALR
jgi:hypothetical protein